MEESPLTDSSLIFEYNNLLRAARTRSEIFYLGACFKFSWDEEWLNKDEKIEDEGFARKQA
jgi:hypothetical protein